MGAPKQKWTAEEEAALKAGVVKHGAGKWRTILKDPEFSGILYMRSNVDLKDKWRNMSVMANGWGSREKSRVAVKRTQYTPKQEENTTSASDVPLSDEEMVDVKPPILPIVPVVSSAPVPPATSKRSIVRLDNLIMEAINNLKEPGGSSKSAIASYIEDQYWAPPDFKGVLSAKLKFLISCGKLIRVRLQKVGISQGFLLASLEPGVSSAFGTRVKRNYRIADFPAFPEQRRNVATVSQEGRQSVPQTDRDVPTLVKSQVDVELAKMRSMTSQEAASAAARAVAEAETAIAEAEEAAKDAETAEADADEAQAFAEAAMRTLRGRSASKMMVRAAI